MPSCQTRHLTPDCEYETDNLLAYAGQVSGRPDDGHLPFDLVVSPAAEVLRWLTGQARRASWAWRAAVD